MEYTNIKTGTFISRPNRFIANVETENGVITAHVKNTGRCLELLKEGTEIYLEFSDNPNRKTPCDLVTVKKGNMLVNIDSQAPNKVFGEYVKSRGAEFIHPEIKFMNSRFDFYTEEDGKKIFTEVKGATLESGGIAMFPDAPTLRGVKHINELCEAIRQGFHARIVFIIQFSPVKYFTPNRKTHPEFADALIKASESGVEIIALDSLVTPHSITAKNTVEVRL